MKNIAIVTGAGRGIGFSISKALLENDFNVVMCARHENDAIAQIQENFGDRVTFISADISNRNDREKVLNTALEKYGIPNMLVNNAGVAPRVRKDMLEITEDDFDYVVDINLKGTYFLTQTVANEMKKIDKGYIVNVGSISATAVSLNRAEYCVSKAGIRMLTQLFAARLAEYNIGVFELSPGVINTDMISTVKTKYDKLAKNGIIPMRRLGEGEDMAKIVLAISNGALDYSTGTVIHCDGGLHIPSL